MDSGRLTGRLRLTPLVEWLIAAGFLAATITVASLVIREVQGPVAVQAEASAPRAYVASTPPAVPAGAVSVPVLPFLDGKDVKVGETAAVIASRLGRAAESGRQDVDRGTLGERLTRFYEYGGTRFILVFEPFERDGEARVAAIYLP